MVNGSFEAPGFDGPFLRLTSGSTELPGWTITGGTDVAIHKAPDFAQAIGNSTFRDARDGSYYLDLSGTGTTPRPTVQQSVPTTPGVFYRLTFYTGASNIVPVAPIISASVGDVSAPLVNATLTPLPPTTVIQWKKETFYFRATATQTPLRFRDLSSSNNEASYVDAVEITALPPTITSPAQAAGTTNAHFVIRSRRPARRRRLR